MSLSPKKTAPSSSCSDNFLAVVETDENESSWHLKIALVRYYRTDDKTDRQWRVSAGQPQSNPCHELGCRFDPHQSCRWPRTFSGRSRRSGAALAARAKLAALSSADVQNELAALTWDCPPGCEVQKITFARTKSRGWLSHADPPDTDRVLVVSPFLRPDCGFKHRAGNYLNGRATKPNAR